MICKGCNIKKICKIYDMITTTDTKLSISICEHYSDSHIPTTEYKEDFQQTMPERQSRALNDVTALSNKMRAQEEAKKKGVEFIEKSQEDMIQCSNCNDKVLMTFSCSNCGKDICPSCATVDLSNPSIMLCGDCELNDEISSELE